MNWQNPILSGAPIAALPAEPSETVQSLMADFAQELIRAGVRVAGVTQTRITDEKTGRRRIALLDLASGARHAISQDLGPGSVACNLDAGALALACAAIENAAREGAELIMISKFAKQEAARGGLSDAFRAAMSGRVPVVAAVSPHFLEEWLAFAGPLAEFVAPRPDALREWWSRARSRGIWAESPKCR